MEKISCNGNSIPAKQKYTEGLAEKKVIQLHNKKRSKQLLYSYPILASSIIGQK